MHLTLIVLCKWNQCVLIFSKEQASCNFTKALAKVDNIIFDWLEIFSCSKETVKRKLKLYEYFDLLCMANFQKYSPFLQYSPIPPQSPPPQSPTPFSISQSLNNKTLILLQISLGNTYWVWAPEIVFSLVCIVFWILYTFIREGKVVGVQWTVITWELINLKRQFYKHQLEVSNKIRYFNRFEEFYFYFFKK